MAQDVALWGVAYADVPQIQVPRQGGGLATFTDTSDTTAAAADVAQGKQFYDASGVLTQGTASGGGTSPWTLLKHTTLTVNTTDTSEIAAGTASCGKDAVTKVNMIWVHIRGQSGKRNGYFYGSDTLFVNDKAANGVSSNFTAPAVEYIMVDSSGSYTVKTGSYGVYGYSINKQGTVNIRHRYSESLTKTINDTFDVYVYSLALPDSLKLFD